VLQAVEPSGLAFPLTEKLARLVTRDSMVGTGLAKSPEVVAGEAGR